MYLSIIASVHQQSPIIDRVAAATPPTLSNLSSDSAYDKFRLLNGHHVSVIFHIRYQDYPFNRINASVILI